MTPNKWQVIIWANEGQIWLKCIIRNQYVTKCWKELCVEQQGNQYFKQLLFIRTNDCIHSSKYLQITDEII